MDEADKRNNQLVVLFVCYFSYFFGAGRDSLSPVTVENAALGYLVLSFVLTNLIVSYGPNDSAHSVFTNCHQTIFVAMRARKKICLFEGYLKNLKLLQLLSGRPVCSASKLSWVKSRSGLVLYRNKLLY